MLRRCQVLLVLLVLLVLQLLQVALQVLRLLLQRSLQRSLLRSLLRSRRWRFRSRGVRRLPGGELCCRSLLRSHRRGLRVRLRWGVIFRRQLRCSVDRHSGERRSLSRARWHSLRRRPAVRGCDGFLNSEMHVMDLPLRRAEAARRRERGGSCY